MTQATDIPTARPNTRPARRRFRQTLFRVHTWLGLHTCLILGLLFMTGTLSLFLPEIEVGARTDLYVSPSSQTHEGPSFGAIYDTVSDSMPEASAAVISAPKRPWFGHKVEIKSADGTHLLAWVHPEDGTVMGVSRNDPYGIKKFILHLHANLMIPGKPGQMAVSALSLVLSVSLVTGIIAYRRFWKGLFRFPARGDDQRKRQGGWHRLLAVWSLPFLIVVALTSFIFFIETLGVKPTYASVDKPSEREAVLPTDFSGATVDRFIARVQADMPSFEPSVVRIPQGKNRPVVISGFETIRPEMRGITSVHFDPATETVLGIRRAHSDSILAGIVSITLSLHFGEFAGLWSVGAWLLFGITSTLLLLTGARIYAARSLADRDGAAALEGRGTFGIVWHGLGLFRWLYVLCVLAVIAGTALEVLKAIF